MLEENDVQKALKYFQESLTLNWEVGDKPGVVSCLTSMAALTLHLDKPIMAARLYGVVRNRLERLSINLLYLDQVELEKIHDRLPACLDEATFKAAFSEGWEMSDEQAMKLVREIIG